MECYFFVAVHEDFSEQENAFKIGVPGADLSNRSLKHCWVMQGCFMQPYPHPSGLHHNDLSISWRSCSAAT